MRGIRSRRLLALLGALALCGNAHANSPGLDSQVTIDIPEQALESALLELSRQAAVQLVISAETVPEQKVPRLVGAMSLKTAIETLLRDTGLSYKWRGDRTI